MNWFIDRFGRHRQLAETLLPHAFPPGNDDGSHDLAHLDRVWGNVQAIVAAEGGDTEILAAAVLLHDCVAVEKNSPLRNQASRLAAEKAVSLLTELCWPKDRQVGPKTGNRPWRMPSRRTASRRASSPEHWRPASCRTRTGWTHWGSWGWSAVSTRRAGWARHCMIRLIRVARIGRLMIGGMRWTTFPGSSFSWRKVSRPGLARSWRCSVMTD